MTNLPAVNGSGVSDYLAKHGSTPAGSYIKFAKDGKYRKTSDDEEVAEDTAMVVVYDQIHGGHIKFLGKGNPPERKMGPVFAALSPRIGRAWATPTRPNGKPSRRPAIRSMAVPGAGADAGHRERRALHLHHLLGTGRRAWTTSSSNARGCRRWSPMSIPS